MVRLATFSTLISLFLCFNFSKLAAEDVEYLRSPLFEEKNLPLSDVVRVGNLMFVSGNLGIDFSTEDLALVPGGIIEETRQALRNIDAALKRNGSSINNVVKCTIFMGDMEEWPALNQVWPEFFSENYPARTAIQAGKLWHDAAVEIECIAVQER